MDDYIVEADAKALDELRSDLMKANIDPRLWQTSGREIPGRTGEPILAAISLALGAAIAVEMAKPVAKKTWRSLRKTINKWRGNHPNASLRIDRDGNNEPVTWERLDQDLDSLENA